MGSQGKSKNSMQPLVLDLDQIIPFLRSVSYAIVAQRTTTLEWSPHFSPGKTPIRHLYTAFCYVFGEPGTVAVATAAEAEIVRKVDIETHHRIDVLMARAEAGPVAVAKYLADLEKIRASCLKSVQEVYSDANAINRDIASELGRSITFLWTIKAGSQVIVKTVGVFSGAVGLVALASDVLGAPIENWAKAGNASAVIMVGSQKAVTGGLEEGASRAAEKLVDKVNGMPTTAELKHAFANMQRIESKLSDQITRIGHKAHLNQLGVQSPRIDQSVKSLTRLAERDAGKLDQAQKGVAKSAGKVALAKLVSVVFVVKDLRELLEKRNAEVEAANR